MSYDPDCYVLACHFLPNLATERLKATLAQAIQNAVEEWLLTEGERLIAELSGALSRYSATPDVSGR